MVIRSSRVVLVRVRTKVRQYRERQPHRSFRRTSRRDSLRPLKLPSIAGHIFDVLGVFRRFKKPFLGLFAIFVALQVLLVGLGSQETYTQLMSVMNESIVDATGTGVDRLTHTFLAFSTVMSAGLSGSLSEGQQIASVLLGLFVWLTTVWLLRNLFAGHQVKLRDALYSAGAPIVAMACLVVLLLLQLLPVGVAILAYNAATSTGLIAGGGAEAMMFWMAVAGLGVLSLYWMMSTLFAMVIVTLPGTYPLYAYSMAGKIIQGRRLQILIRVLAGVVPIAGLWVAVMIPTIYFTTLAAETWEWVNTVPFIPLAILLLSSATVMWASAYVYVLYRRVVDDDARQS